MSLSSELGTMITLSTIRYQPSALELPTDSLARGCNDLIGCGRTSVCQIWRCDLTYSNGTRIACRIFKKAVQHSANAMFTDMQHGCNISHS